MSAVEPLGEPVPVLAGFLPPDLPGPAPLRILLPARELVQVTARRGAMVGGATLGGLGLVLPPP
ncbi:MAG: hypothetical protein JWP04_3618, partial [Belnapia sp.]|nr:hypothetical protein [Belnapia sp.]